MEKKKSNKGLVFLVVVLFILLLGAAGYICYDKGVFDGLLSKEKSNSKTEEKLSEEEVNKLHNGLITTSNKFGFYFNRKVSIDEVPGEIMLEYAISNYLDQNNIKYNIENMILVCGDNPFEYYFCTIDDDGNEHKIDNNDTKSMTISRDVINKYISDNFDTNRNFVPTDNFTVFSKSNILDVFYNSDKKEYYLVVPHRDGVLVNMKTKMLKYEQKNDELYIYDKVVICQIENGGACGGFLYVNYNEASDDAKSLFYWNSINKVYDKNDKVIANGEKYLRFSDSDIDTNLGYNFDFDLIFNDFDSELKTFKHIFKKANDGKYYWYSSEIINE